MAYRINTPAGDKSPPYGISVNQCKNRNCRVYKKSCPAAPFKQGATGLKPKGMICDSKDSCLTIIQSVEIISYLHYTVGIKTGSSQSLHLISVCSQGEFMRKKRPWVDTAVPLFAAKIRMIFRLCKYMRVGCLKYCHIVAKMSVYGYICKAI